MMTAAERDAILAALIVATRPWDPATTFVGLFEAITDMGVSTVIADVTAPTGAPGVRKPVTTWSAAHVKADGRAMIDSPLLRWTPTDDTEATTVQGWYVATLITGGVLYRFGLFDDPIPLPDEHASLALVLRYTVDPISGLWDATVVMNG
jgi:hypothetical protein